MEGMLLALYTQPSAAKPRSADSNYYAVLIDGALFFTAMTFAAAATVIPTFARELGASPLIIGLAPTLANLGWMIPQLFSARYVQQLTRRRPYVLTMMGSQRICYLIMALLCWLIPTENPGLLLTSFLIVYLLASIFDGIGTPAWLEFVAASVPERRRGSLFAARTLISCFTGLAAGWLTRLTLDSYAFPANFGFVFLWAFLLFATGWTVFARLTWEQPSEQPKKPPASLTSYLRQIPVILSADVPFRRYVLTMTLMLFGQMGMAFFSVYGLDRMGLPPSYVGYFTISMSAGQMLASIFAGRLADAKGHKINLQLSCIAMGMAALVLLMSSNLFLTFCTFILLGIANTTHGVSRLPIVMEYAPEGFRAVYAGIVNTLLAPVVLLTPIIGGRLVETYGYSTVFIATIIINVAAGFTFFFGVQDPRTLEEKTPMFSETL